MLAAPCSARSARPQRYAASCSCSARGPAASPGRRRLDRRPARVALLLALVAVAGVRRRSGGKLLSRRIEARADAHALDLTGDPETFERLQRRLASTTWPTPTPTRWSTAVRQPPVHVGADRAGPGVAAAGRSDAVSGRVLLVTNDFPPRPGGIQQFVHNLRGRQPPDSLVGVASTWQGAAEFDAEQPFPVVREDRDAAAHPGGGPAGGRDRRVTGCDGRRSVRPRRSGCSRRGCVAGWRRRVVA